MSLAHALLPRPSRRAGAAAAPLLLAMVALTACDARPAGEAVRLLDYEATVPPSLEARPAANAMRLAEFSVPRDDGTEAEVVVYWFGEGQGGDAQANIARWAGQFTTPDGAPVTPEVTTPEGTAFPTTVAAFQGTYARGIGMGPTQGEPGQALVAAVVEAPRGNLFLQLHGDREAVAATRGDFLEMVGSIRPAPDGG